MVHGAKNAYMNAGSPPLGPHSPVQMTLKAPNCIDVDLQKCLSINKDRFKYRPITLLDFQCVLRDQSLIIGGGGQNRKIAGPKLVVPPPQDRVKLSAPLPAPILKVGNYLRPHPISC